MFGKVRSTRDERPHLARSPSLHEFWPKENRSLSMVMKQEIIKNADCRIHELNDGNYVAIVEPKPDRGVQLPLGDIQLCQDDLFGFWGAHRRFAVLLWIVCSAFYCFGPTTTRAVPAGNLESKLVAVSRPQLLSPLQSTWAAVPSFGNGVPLFKSSVEAITVMSLRRPILEIRGTWKGFAAIAGVAYCGRIKLGSLGEIGRAFRRSFQLASALRIASIPNAVFWASSFSGIKTISTDPVGFPFTYSLSGLRRAHLGSFNSSWNFLSSASFESANLKEKYHAKMPTAAAPAANQIASTPVQYEADSKNGMDIRLWFVAIPLSLVIFAGAVTITFVKTRRHRHDR
jgi:hypothetical protein